MQRKYKVLQIEENDFISLTDLIKKFDNRFDLIENLLRNKNTIDIRL